MENSNEYFGVVKWTEADLISALTENDIEVTEENVANLRRLCEHHSFTDIMIEAGWDYIYNSISSSDNFKKSALLLDLSNFDNISKDKIIEDYYIITSDVTFPDGSVHQAWCWDDSIDTLFADSNIIVGETFDKKKEFVFQENLGPVGCDYNDYLYTIELFQNNEEFLFPVYCIWNGNEADIGIVFDNPISL